MVWRGAQNRKDAKAEEGGVELGRSKAASGRRDASAQHVLPSVRVESRAVSVWRARLEWDTGLRDVRKVLGRALAAVPAPPAEPRVQRDKNIPRAQPWFPPDGTCMGAELWALSSAVIKLNEIESAGFLWAGKEDKAEYFLHFPSLMLSCSSLGKSCVGQD